MHNYHFVHSPTNINYNAVKGNCTYCGAEMEIISRDPETNWPRTECPNKCVEKRKLKNEQ